MYPIQNKSSKKPFSTKDAEKGGSKRFSSFVLFPRQAGIPITPWVRNVDLVEVINSFTVNSYNLTRNTYNSTIRFNIFNHNCTGGNFCISANGNWAEDLSTRAYHYSAFNSGMALADIFTRSAKCNTLVNHNIVAYFSCFADNNTVTVVNTYPPADCSTGMNFNSCFVRTALAYISCNKRHFMV